jgi:hypothetical protein
MYTERNQNGYIQVKMLTMRATHFNSVSVKKMTGMLVSMGLACALTRKAFGADWGVSKRASVTIAVIAKAIKGVAHPDEDLPPFRFRTVADALDLILKDDQEKKIQHRAVASLPFGFPPIGSFCTSSGRIPKLGDPLFPMYEATQTLLTQVLL